MPDSLKLQAVKLLWVRFGPWQPVPIEGLACCLWDEHWWQEPRAQVPA